jgi:hypothetical protein
VSLEKVGGNLKKRVSKVIAETTEKDDNKPAFANITLRSSVRAKPAKETTQVENAIPTLEELKARKKEKQEKIEVPK